LLKEAGYAVGVSGKGWGPGRTESASRELEGKRYGNFQAFLEQRPKDKPFCFWLGSSDPHRPYQRGSGAARGMDLEKVHLFGCFPDHPAVRGDVADYYFEVERFDRLVGDALASLDEIGELNDTLVLMTGDHGMPFPRCKGNVYDSGARVPLAVRWPGRVKAGRAIDDFVRFTDFAPTLLAVAGLEPLPEMTGRSLTGVLAAGASGRVDPKRDFVLIGKERHVPGQEAPDMGGYPCRAIRTHQFLYIRNFEPDRWPAGTPHYQKAAVPGAWLADCDNGPAKSYMVDNRDKDAAHRRLYELAFGKRPAEELYDLENDPEQLDSVAGDPDFGEVRRKLSERLMKELEASGDPRVVGGGEKFDQYPYLGGAPKHPDFRPGKPQGR
jgi:arylsulfatase A-like enzyme